MHNYRDKLTKVQVQGYSHAPIIIEEDTWVGTHAVIFPGVKLGRGSVVGSNSVVNKSTKEYTVVGGIPAKELKYRE